MSPVDRKNLIYSSFIGLPVEIENSSQRSLLGLKGIVIDETKNLIVIETGQGKERKVQKSSATFRFTLPDGSASVIEGRRIVFRPHERPKKV